MVDFDFRWYSPYHQGQLVGGGVYVFKTTDKNSSPYVHKLKSIKVYQGKSMQMFILSYQNRVGPLSQVKVKLASNPPSDSIEFDVFFAALDKKKY